MKLALQKLKFALALILSALTASATNPIEVYAGPARVVVLSQAAAFGAEHVVRPFNGLSMINGGAPYQPEGGKWFRLTKQDGSVFDEAEANRTILRKDHVGLDGAVITPWRMFPAEAIEPLAAVIVGDSVKIQSKSAGATADAKVTSINQSNWTIGTDYAASSGDSGSVVTTPAGVFVGFVSAAVGTPAIGSLVSVPPISPTWTAGNVVAGKPDATPTTTTPENVPAIVTDSPPPVLPVLTVEQAYQNGFTAGKREALKALQADLESILARVKSAL